MPPNILGFYLPPCSGCDVQAGVWFERYTPETPPFRVGFAEPEEDDVIPVEGEEGNMLGKLLQQQTKILAQLAASPKWSSDPLSASAAEEEDSKAPGVGGMAAGSSATIEGTVPEAAQSGLRACPRTARCCRAEDRADGQLQLCDCHSEEVVALIALALVFCEQVANESGHTRLAWLLSCRDDPPFSAVEQHRAPRAEIPQGMLSATHLAYLKDVDSIQDRAAKARNPRIPGPTKATDPSNPKGGGRNRSQKSQHAGTKEPAA